MFISFFCACATLNYKDKEVKKNEDGIQLHEEEKKKIIKILDY